MVKSNILMTTNSSYSNSNGLITIYNISNLPTLTTLYQVQASTGGGGGNNYLVGEKAGFTLFNGTDLMIVYTSRPSVSSKTIYLSSLTAIKYQSTYYTQTTPNISPINISTFAYSEGVSLWTNSSSISSTVVNIFKEC